MTSKNPCTFEGCPHTIHAHGLCSTHLGQLRRNGTLKPTRGMRPKGMTQSELVAWALESRTELDDGCLIWQGARDKGGYAVVGWGKRMVTLTRLILAEQLGLAIEDLPRTTHALHSCDRGAEGCVSPEHIHQGSHQDNVREMHERSRSWQKSRTHCPRGHSLVEGNLVLGNLPKRRCLLCNRAQSLVAVHRKRGEELSWDDAVERTLKKYPEMARAALDHERMDP